MRSLKSFGSRTGAFASIWYHLICRRYFRIYIGFGFGDRGHTGAGGFLGSIGLSLMGIGLILTVRASFTLFTNKDEMVGLHLHKEEQEEDS